MSSLRSSALRAAVRFSNHSLSLVLCELRPLQRLFVGKLGFTRAFTIYKNGTTLRKQGEFNTPDAFCVMQGNFPSN